MVIAMCMVMFLVLVIVFLSMLVYEFVLVLVSRYNSPMVGEIDWIGADFVTIVLYIGFDFDGDTGFDVGVWFIVDVQLINVMRAVSSDSEVHVGHGAVTK